MFYQEQSKNQSNQPIQLFILWIAFFLWDLITYLKSQVSSVNKFDPPLDVVAARDHMFHLVYHMMQPQVLFDRLVQF